MRSDDAEPLLGMVKDLNDALDRYLVGTVKASEVAPRLIETCRRMRECELNNGAEYWLGAIEQHAAAIRNAPVRSWDDGPLYRSETFLGMQLLKDIYYLRLQLTNGRGSLH